MPSKPTLHLDPKLKKLTLEKSAKLEFRVCCVCGVIKNVDDFEGCLSCDGFMCSEHKSDEHARDCLPSMNLTNFAHSVRTSGKPN